MSDCGHENFFVHADVVRLTDVEGGPATAFTANITVICDTCKTPFRFLGMGVGSSPLEPMTDVAGTELRAPIVPVGQEEMVGRLGYRVSMRSGKASVVE